MSFVDPSVVGLRLTEESRAYTSPSYDDFIVIGYVIANTSGTTKTGIRVGLFFDWDIDEGHFFTNRADWDAARGLGYAYDTTDPTLPYFGVMVLKGGTQTLYSAFAPSDFTETGKWNAMTGVYGTSTGPGDVSNLLSTGPFTLVPGDSLPVWFALVGGHTLAELQANADQARALWASLVAVGPQDLPIAVSLAELRPNPFASGTRLQLSLDRARTIAAGVYDVRGRQVRHLGERVYAAGPASLEWDGKDDRGSPVRAGVYFFRIESDHQHWVKKAILIR
jgi:hypothetical protein